MNDEVENCTVSTSSSETNSDRVMNLSMARGPGRWGNTERSSITIFLFCCVDILMCPSKTASGVNTSAWLQVKIGTGEKELLDVLHNKNQLNLDFV